MTTLSKPFLALTARDLMTEAVVTIPQEMPLRTAARLLTDHHISGAPVVDEKGCCTGFLSAPDFLSLWARYEVWGDGAVKLYMTADPVLVGPAMPLVRLARLMIDAHIHHLIVANEERRPIGVVSSTDVLAAVIYRGVMNEN